jgi:hypothetical protein
VGRDPALLAQRELSLMAAGMEVCSVTPEEAEPEARSALARPWLICHTVEITQVVYLACSVRRNSPASKLILLEGERAVGFESVLFHHVLKVPEQRDVLVNTIRKSLEDCLRNAS